MDVMLWKEKSQCSSNQEFLMATALGRHEHDRGEHEHRDISAFWHPLYSLKAFIVEVFLLLGGAA